MRSFLFLFIFLQMQLNAQTPVKCVVDAIMSEKKISINQHIKACGSHEMINQYALKCQPKQSATNGINQKQSSMVYTLPVVVHVVSNGDAVGMGENISDLQVLSQIDKLNDDFRLLNADATSIPAVFAGLAADVEIEFCLAQRKPDGSPTNGIDRITIAQADWVQAQIESNLKPPTIWDREKYINIWVVRLNAAEPLNGYAYLPYPPADIDGIVVGHDAFGTVGTLVSPTNQGRTCVHEMGHFFDLNHIWGDEDGCASDDGISDTPLQKSNNTGCPTFPLITGLGAACSGAAGAMYMNYMDYTNDACMAMFTLGQKVKMLAALTGPRSSLLSSNGCMPTSAPPIANFTATGTSICAGGNVLFENTSNFATSYTWTFAGGTPATSTGINPNITYNTAGVYAVTLTATNAFGSDLQSYAAYINVNNCGITPCQSITTVVPSSLSFFTYPAGDGYLSGHNAFGDKAKANYFNYAGSPTTVNSIRMYFHKAYSSSPSGFVKYCVWDNDGPGGSPGSLLGSQNVLIDHINDSLFSGFYRYSAALSTPIPVNGGFYAGVQYSYPSTSGTDTIALLSSGAGVLTSAGATAWEQLSSGAWVDFSTSHAINISHHVYLKIGTLPDANFTIPTGPFCPGDAIALTNTSTASTSYSWNTGGGLPSSSTLMHPSISYSTGGTKTISLTASNGCGTNLQTNTVLISANPTATISSSASSICIGNNVTLTGTGAGASGTYQWLAPSYSASTASITTTPTSTTTYTLNTTNTAGCEATSSYIVNVLSPTASISAPNDSICIGNTMTLTASSTTGLNSWLPAGTVATISSTTGTIAPTATTTYTLTNTIGTCTATDNITIQAIAAPVLTIASSTPTSCPNTSVVLSVTPTPAGDYVWSNGVTATSITINENATTSYTLNYSDGLCNTTTSFTQNVYAASPATTITYDALTLNATTATTYQWLLDGNPLLGAVAGIYAPTVNGLYSVITTDANGCSDTSNTILVSDLVSINEIEMAVNVVPNPFTNTITIATTSHETMEIMLYDALGKTILQAKLNGTIQLSTVDVSAGVYFIKISGNSNENSVIKKLIKYK